MEFEGQKIKRKIQDDYGNTYYHENTFKMDIKDLFSSEDVKTMLHARVDYYLNDDLSINYTNILIFSKNRVRPILKLNEYYTFSTSGEMFYKTVKISAYKKYFEVTTYNASQKPNQNIIEKVGKQKFNYKGQELEISKKPTEKNN